MKKDQKGVFLSIIIPVYNVQKYLEQCVGSIINQKQDDIEIILVDDGSTDQSGLLCDEFAKEYSFVKTVHQENQGLGYARNTGFRNASGKYIWYVDSDDYITDNAIEWIVEKLEEELDVLLFLATSFSDDASIDTHYKRSHNLDQITSGIKYLENSFRSDEYITSVCLRVYRRNFLEENQLLFGKEELHEDEQYSFLSLLWAERVMATNCVLYMRRYRLGSKMVSACDYSEDSFLKHFDGYKTAIERLIYVYESANLNETGKKMVIKQISYYYQLILGRYVVLDVYTAQKYRELIKGLNYRLAKYKGDLSFMASVMMRTPRLYRWYKRLKQIYMNNENKMISTEG